MTTFKRNFAVATMVTLLRIISLCSPTVLAQEVSVAQAEFTNNLAQFVAHVAEDKGVCALLSKHQITLAYHIKDQNIDCYVGFINGKVQAAYGRPSTKTDLVFVSSSKTLDRLFRGEDCVNEMNVTVELSLGRKLALKRDIKPLREAMARVYLGVTGARVSNTVMIAQNTGN